MVFVYRYELDYAVTDRIRCWWVELRGCGGMVPLKGFCEKLKRIVQKSCLMLVVLHESEIRCL